MSSCRWVKTCLEWICCGSILSLVEILFPLFQTHYHQITITKTKEIKFQARIKLNHNTYTLNLCSLWVLVFVRCRLKQCEKSDTPATVVCCKEGKRLVKYRKYRQLEIKATQFTASIVLGENVLE